MLTVLRKLFGALALLWLALAGIVGLGLLMGLRDAAVALLLVGLTWFPAAGCAAIWFALKVVHLLSRRVAPPVAPVVAYTPPIAYPPPAASDSGHRWLG